MSGLRTSQAVDVRVHVRVRSRGGQWFGPHRRQLPAGERRIELR